MCDISILNIFTYAYLDLPRGVEWMIRVPYTPALGFKQHPFWRCWYRHLEAIFVFCFWDGSPPKKKPCPIEAIGVTTGRLGLWTTWRLCKVDWVNLSPPVRASHRAGVRWLPTVGQNCMVCGLGSFYQAGLSEKGLLQTFCWFLF